MQKQRVKTSMSVPEMGKMLGLGKVESYWLVKKNYFKTIQVVQLIYSSTKSCNGLHEVH